MFPPRLRRSLMIKLKPLAPCNGRFRNRKSSAIRTLVAETLVLAKTHGYVEKIEHELEAELARDIRDPPKEKVKRWQRGGDKIFKSKHMLLTVVILCIADCALVLGELALDLYKVKATLEQTDSITKNTKAFLDNMAEIHPHINDKRPYEVFSLLLNSDILWADRNGTGTNLSEFNFAGIPCSPDVDGVQDSSEAYVSPAVGRTEKRNLTMPFYREPHEDESHDIEIVGRIAHVFHYCSITILLIILIETILKGICAGKEFFHRKLEMFDAFVVLMSFITDFSFIVFLPDIDTKDFVFILAILLPWRVIRVVNSLVVSVKDHEHFRLKLVYKRKKKIQGNLRDTEALLQKYIGQVTTLHRLCIIEGVDEWKVDHCLKAEESAPTTPSKKKFKFKLDDTMLGSSRAPRCSLPSLEIHGLKLPSNGAVSKSRISLPSVANTIKDHIKKTSRRASLAAVEMCNLKSSLNELRKRKSATDNLCTMQEEEFNDLKDDKTDSLTSSRASSLTGTEDDLSSSQYSLRTCPRGNSLTRASTCSDESDEVGKLNEIQESAKRRLSESNVDKRRLSYGMTDLICFKDASGKTYTKPYVTGDRYVSYDEGAHSSDDEARASVKLGCLTDSIDVTDNEMADNVSSDDDVDDVIIIEVPSRDSIIEMGEKTVKLEKQSPNNSQVNIEHDISLDTGFTDSEKKETTNGEDNLDSDIEQLNKNKKPSPIIDYKIAESCQDASKSLNSNSVEVTKHASISDDCNAALEHQILEKDPVPSETRIEIKTHKVRQNLNEHQTTPGYDNISRIANGVNEDDKSSTDIAHVSDTIDSDIETATVVKAPRTVIDKRKDNLIIEYEIKENHKKK